MCVCVLRKWFAARGIWVNDGVFNRFAVGGS